MQLNVLSHSADVSGKVHKILSNLFTLGKRLLSQALSALAAVFGLSFSATSCHSILLYWWIVVVPEVALNLAFLSIFQD